LKDAARLLIYLAASIVLAALIAPLLFWAAQAVAAHGLVPFIASIDFERFFHRSLLIALLALLWPFLRWVGVQRLHDLALDPNPRWLRHLSAGFLLAAIPLLCCGAILLALHFFSPRSTINWFALAKVSGAAIVVPFIEETFFRGLVLGVLLRTGHKYLSIFATSALFSIVHFLKAPEQTSTIVSWTSGFNSLAHSFSQFANPMLVAAAFTTLFLIAWIMADARLRTRSLWLPIGLHAGWILSSGVFNRVARHGVVMLPWLGKNLLVGIVPLMVGCLTWLLMRAWLKYADADKT
jgi:membrane protease YdiL (CAAX protease family)